MNFQSSFVQTKPKGANAKNAFVMGPPIRPPKKKSATSSSFNWGKSTQCASSSLLKTTTSITTEIDDHCPILALTEGRGEARCEVGLAVLNPAYPIMKLCQISDSQSYIKTLTKINFYEPSQIIVPHTFLDCYPANRLIESIKQQFPEIKFTSLARSNFNMNTGKERLQNLCVPSLNSVMLVLQHRYYALSAASGLLTYLHNNMNIYFTSNSMKIIYEESEGYAIIDISSADRLELVRCQRPSQKSKYSTLFGTLNNCLTKIGSRLLRSSILQPMFNVDLIESRLACVAELVENPERLLNIQANLQRIKNIDQILSISTLVPSDVKNYSDRQLNYILLLKNVTDMIVPLKDSVKQFKHGPLKELGELLESRDFVSISQQLKNVICENAQPAKGQTAVLQRCYAIKSGLNGLLDIMRKKYTDRLEEMREYIRDLGNKYNLPLTLGNNNTKGYHIILTLSGSQKRTMKQKDLPEEFFEIFRLSGSFTMKTAELMNMSTRMDDIMQNIMMISDVMVNKIITELKKHLSLFYKLCEVVAEVDLLQSLASISEGSEYTKPTFSDFTEITFGQHPMLRFLCANKFVTNPIQCCKFYNAHIITGPNGAGKSIYIRQVMLLQIMAQIGCYVPAQTATFRPADKMFARICHDDDMDCGASAFVLEIKEISYILNNLTSNSLVIIDELCKTTGVEEGAALAMAIYEEFITSKAFIYIATHYTLLTKLHEMYINVKVWQMETTSETTSTSNVSSISTAQLEYKYNLIPGVTALKRYGINLILNIWPSETITEIQNILNTLSKPPDARVRELEAKSHLKHQLAANINKYFKTGKLTLSKLNRLIDNYNVDLQKVWPEPQFEPAYNKVYMKSFLDKSKNILPSTVAQKLHSIFYRDLVALDGSTLNDNFNSEFVNSPNGQFNRTDFVSFPDDIPMNEDDTMFSQTAYRSSGVILSHNLNLTQDDVQSIQEDLNYYTEILNEGRFEDFDEKSNFPFFNDKVDNLPQYPSEANFQLDSNKEQLEMNNHIFENYISPEVIIVEGPDNTSISIDAHSEADKSAENKSSSFEVAQENELNLKTTTEASLKTASKSGSTLNEDNMGETYGFPSTANKTVNKSSSFEIAQVNELNLRTSTETSTKASSKSGNTSNDNNMEHSFGSSSVLSYSQKIVKNIPENNSSSFELIQGNELNMKTITETNSKTTNKCESTSNNVKDSFDSSSLSNHSQNIKEIIDNLNSTNSSISHKIKSPKVHCKLMKSKESGIQKGRVVENEDITIIPKSKLEERIKIIDVQIIKKGVEENIKKSEVAELGSTSKNETKLSKSDSNKESKKKTSTKRKFIPPLKYSKKEIRDEFFQQDRKLIEMSINSDEADWSKYLELQMRRPSVAQVQSAVQLATIRKTTEGVTVIHHEPKAKKPRKVLPILRSSSHEIVDVTMFSDRNAEPFEEFLNSKETNFNISKTHFYLPQENNINYEFKFNDSCIVTPLKRKGDSFQAFAHKRAPEPLMNVELTPTEHFKDQNISNVEKNFSKNTSNIFQERNVSFEFNL